MTVPRFRQTRFIAIRVRNFAHAVAFYRDVLGLRLATAADAEARFEGDANTLFIEAMPASESASDEAVAATHGRYAGKSFFEFEVDDFAAARERLLAAGCRESSSGVCGAQSADAVACSAMFSDPFGLSYHIYHPSAVLPEIDTIRVEARFVGRVQGVGFRASVMRLVTTSPALKGWVRNERDGSVAMVAQGKATEVDALVEAIRARWTTSIVQCELTRTPLDPSEGAFAIK